MDTDNTAARHGDNPLAEDAWGGQPEPDEGGSSSRSRFRKTLTNALVAAGAFLIGVLLAEGLVRLVAPQQLIVIRPDIWKPVGGVGWERRGNLDTRINTGEREVRLLTDEEGFRVGASGRQVAEDSVLLIGDSFMAALQVEYEQSLAGLMEVRAAEDIGTGLAVRNTAVGAWDSSHYRILAGQRLSRFRYDLVLVAVFVGNDVVHEEIDSFPPRQPVDRARLRWPRSVASAEIVDALARPVNDFLEVRSHLYILLRTALEPLRIRLGLSAAYVPRTIRKAYGSSPDWRLTAEILAQIDGMREDTPTLYVLIPNHYQIDRNRFRAHTSAFGIDTVSVDLDQPNWRLRNELSRLGLDVVDALPAFRQAHAEGSQLYGDVDPHLTAQGHEVLYGLVLPHVAAILRDAR